MVQAMLTNYYVELVDIHKQVANCRFWTQATVELYSDRAVNCIQALYENFDSFDVKQISNIVFKTYSIKSYYRRLQLYRRTKYEMNMQFDCFFLSKNNLQQTRTYVLKVVCECA